YLPSWTSLFFFFIIQAEDGIRDGHVTGVETCALPICLDQLFIVAAHVREQALAGHGPGLGRGGGLDEDDDAHGWAPGWWCGIAQIGRASCRERGGVSEGDGEGERNREE